MDCIGYNPHRSLGRSYKAPGDQSPLSDIDRRDVVCQASEPAGYTEKSIPGGTVVLVNRGAGRASSARIARINQEHKYSAQRSLVENQAPQFVESPVMQSSPLSPCGLNPITYAFEIFEGNRRTVAFGCDNNCFGNAVVGVTLKTRLFSAVTLEGAFRRSGADLLQSLTPRMATAANRFNLLAAKAIAAIVASQIDNAQIDAKNITGFDGSGSFNLAGKSQHPLAAHKHQVCLALRGGKSLSLMLSTDERNFYPSTKRPERNAIRQQAKDTLIEGLRGMALEYTPCRLIASFNTIGHFGNRTYYCLCRQCELFAHLSVGNSLQIKLSLNVLLVCDTRQPITGSIATFQRGTQQRLLLKSGQQSNSSDQLHCQRVYMRCAWRPHRKSR